MSDWTARHPRNQGANRYRNETTASSLAFDSVGRLLVSGVSTPGVANVTTFALPDGMNSVRIVAAWQDTSGKAGTYTATATINMVNGLMADPSGATNGVSGASSGGSTLTSAIVPDFTAGQPFTIAFTQNTNPVQYRYSLEYINSLGRVL